MVFALTKAPVLVEGRGGAEQLSTVFTFDLSTAVGMHTFVTTEVGELSVGLVAHLTWGSKKTQPIRAWLNPF